MNFPDKIIEDFSRPQRQSPIGVIVETIYTFQKTLRAWWPLLILFVLRIKDIGWQYSILGASVMILLIGLFGYLNYRNFLFFINEDENAFVLTSGVLSKKKTILDFSKIQQVNINQSFIQRLFDVYEVEIDTAGSTKNEAKIKAVSKTVALYLRERLFTARTRSSQQDDAGETDAQPAAEVSSSPLVQISPGSLIKIAITSDYLKSLALIVASLTALYDKVKDVLFKDQLDETAFFDYLASLELTPFLLLFGIVLLAFVIVFNLVRTLFTYYGFTVRLANKTLQLSYGLFNRRNTLIQPEKVQKVKVTSNYFQRRMDLRRILVSKASGNVLRDKKATIRIPGCTTLESERILLLLFDRQPRKGFMIKPDIRRVLSSVYQFIFMPVAALFIFTLLRGDVFIFWIILPVYLIMASFLIYISFQRNRLFIKDEFIIKQSGIWDIDTEIISPVKIQAISTKQNIWHKRSNIGHLVLHTAGGNIIFKFGDFSLINKYVNYWLYQVESSDDEWM